MSLSPSKHAADLDTFVARWSAGDGGQERANYALFLAELCDVLDVPRPDQASHEAAVNAYAFERGVTFREPDGSTTRGRIDLYRRGSFVLEAKQSRRPGAAKAMPEQGDLLAAEEADSAPRKRNRRGRVVTALRPAPRPRRFRLPLAHPGPADGQGCISRCNQQSKRRGNTMTKTLTKADMAQFTGSEQWYRHGLVRDVLFTDGAKYVADAAGAYWLIDEIALAQRLARAASIAAICSHGAS